MAAACPTTPRFGWQRSRVPSKNQRKRQSAPLPLPTIARGELGELTTQRASSARSRFVFQRFVAAARNRARLPVPTESAIAPRLGSRDRVGECPVYRATATVLWQGCKDPQ